MSTLPANGRFGEGSRGILVSLWGFAFLSYLLRTNISVAQQQMARELHWSDMQVGYVFAAFLIGYTIFQVPAGVLGDRFGPRLVLGISGAAWAVTTLLTGLVPGLLAESATLSLWLVLMIRFTHGVEESSTYPVAMTAVADWYPPRDHAFVNSLIFTGSTLGAAFAPPLVANIMNALGWRAAFYVTALLPLLLAAYWWRQTTGRPHHKRVRQKEAPGAAADWWRISTRKNVLVLCLSYFLYCYAISIFVYWLFKYLVDVRHLSIVSSGWANSLPWIVASVTVPVLGHVSRRLSARMGALAGRRRLAVICLIVSAALMFAGAGTAHIGLALGAIAASVGLLFSTESSYWSTAIDLAAENAGAVSGLMNLAGNLGGVASTLLVPVLVGHFGWFLALLSGSLLAVLAALCWFLIRAGNKSQPSVNGLGSNSAVEYS
ncbi:MAG TPA: MFS transporter [Bryobacteraceae bacterium]